MKSPDWKITLLLNLAAGLVLAATGVAGPGGKLKVVSSLPDFAAIAREIGGDRVTTDYVVDPDEDPHFVAPKPSLALKVRDADVWITTGLDLEMWSPALMDKARNNNILEGNKGYVSASAGLNLLEKLAPGVTRSEGDIHIFGNPHIQTGPQNWKQIGENILIGLIKNDQSGESYYRANYAAFCTRVDSALFGPELVKLIGPDRLYALLENGTLFEFLKSDYQGQPLENSLGGWLKAAMPLRGQKIITYHKSWPYFAVTFGLEVVDYIEPKPGIPPSARHVRDLIDLIKAQNVRLMIVESYFEKNTAQMIEERTGIKAVTLQPSCGGAGPQDDFALIDLWIKSLNDALK